MMSDPVKLEPGNGLRVVVDGEVYALDAVDPGAGADLRPKAGPDRVKAGDDHPLVELRFVAASHPNAVVVAPDDGEPDGGLAFERDLSLRHARVAESYLQVVRIALNENRPLEALNQANNALEELDEALDGLERLGEVRDE